MMLLSVTQELAAQLRALGVRTFPTETYFFLANFAPRNAAFPTLKPLSEEEDA